MKDMREEEESNLSSDLDRVLRLAKSSHCAPLRPDSTDTQSALIGWMTLLVHPACWAVNLHVCANAKIALHLMCVIQVCYL